MGKCCISGAGALKIDYKNRTLTVDGHEYHEGDWISLNGSTGNIIEGKVATMEPELSGEFAELMLLTDKYGEMKVRTNADTPNDAKIARNFGAQGIGLTRTEHMFFEVDRIKAMREMILADTVKGRKQALDELLPMQRSDFEGIFEAMDGLSVTIRLLDPPLHEFVPHQLATQKELAEDMHIPLQAVKNKVAELEEFNPMLGHRGCRLGNTYPEITEMQTRAIIEAALNLKERGIICKPEIMVPLVGTVKEFEMQEGIIRSTAETIFAERNDRIDYLVGTMIEVPRAALVADLIAEKADFFSFGTNDLTQMTFGYSRDDASKFLPIYIEKGILKVDPFEVIDEEGVGQLVKIGTERGRSIKPNLKVGICGEHGGEPSSVEFCYNTGMDYVSCSPYRVPIARLVSAQAAVKSTM
jgi:pyruvate,orthophosphate dikinase